MPAHRLAPAAALLAMLVCLAGCLAPAGNPPEQAVTVTFDGHGTWDELHPQLAGFPTRTVSADVTWHIQYLVTFDPLNPSIKTEAVDVSGNGSAAHADQAADGSDIVCDGPIVPDQTQLAAGEPSLTLADGSFPSLQGNPVGHFLAQAMGSYAYHLCDPAWATGIHSFPGYDSVTGFAPLTIDLRDWSGLTQLKQVTVPLPPVDATETEQEHEGGQPASLDIHWTGQYILSNSDALGQPRPRSSTP